MKIFVAGTLGFDTIETPFGKKEKILGGSSNYYCLAAAMFNPLELSAIVGTDFPVDFINEMNARGIGTSNLEIIEDETFHWKARYEGSMNEAITLETHLNAITKYNPKLNDLIKNCEILFLANLKPDCQLNIIKQTPWVKAVITDTMNLWIDNMPKELNEVIKLTDILIVNEGEAKKLSQEFNINNAAKYLVKQGPKVLIIKRGEYGSFAYTKDDIFYVPAYPLEKVFDPTGAGDTYAGGFTGYLSTTDDPFNFQNIKKAMIYGSVTSSFAVEDFGIEAIYKATKKDIDDRYNKFLKMISL